MKLVIINGPCGIGKSTVAKELHKVLPAGSVLISVDEVRHMVNKRHEIEEESRELSLCLTRGILDEALRDGRDVVIDKMLYPRSDYGDMADALEVYRAIGEKYDAMIHEILLWSSEEVLLKRATARGFKKDHWFTPEIASAYWHELNNHIRNKPEVDVILTDNLSSDETLNKVLELIN